MDAEKLINIVRNHPEIYDVSYKKHSDRDFISNLWKQIAIEFNTKW